MGSGCGEGGTRSCTAGGGRGVTLRRRKSPGVEERTGHRLRNSDGLLPPTSHENTIVLFPSEATSQSALHHGHLSINVWRGWGGGAVK